MLQYERYAMILDYLNEHHTASVGDLSALLDVSDSTIRRDLIDMDNKGQIKRVFGGVVLPDAESKAVFMDMATKSAAFVEEKRSIAAYAAELIEDDEYVYLDAGTTTGAMIPFLKNKSVTYVTNAVKHAMDMAARGLKAFVISGRLRAETEAIVGSIAVKDIRKYHFDKCFIGTDAVDLSRGLTTSDTEEAMIKEEAMHCGRRVFILADHSKFDKTAQVRFGSLDEGITLTDKVPPKRYPRENIVVVKGGKR